MSGPELATAFAAGLIGVALGVAMITWHWWQAEQGADALGPLSLRLAHAIWALRGYYSDKGAVDFLHDRLASLQASLDGAVAELCDVTGQRDDLLAALKVAHLALDKHVRKP